MSLPRIAWRRELLTVTVAAMEVSWAYPFMLIFGGAIGPRFLSLFSAFFLLLVAIYLSRLLAKIRPSYSQPAMAILALLITMLIIKEDLFPNYALLDHQWVGELLRVGNILAGELITPGIMAFIASLYLWWRGINLGRESLGPYFVSHLFGLGMVALTGAVVLGIVLLPFDMAPFVLLYFLSALLAMALARVEKAQEQREAPSPFNIYWLAVPGSAILTLLFLGTVASYLLSLKTVGPLRFWMGKILPPLLHYLLLPFAFLAQIISSLLSRLSIHYPQLTAPVSEEPSTTVASPFLERMANFVVGFLNILVVVVPIILFLVVVWFTARSLRRWQEMRRGASSEIRRSILSPALLAQDLASFLRGAWGSLTGDEGLAGLKDRLRPWREDLSSIRGIYATMLRFAANLGFPRRPGETPYEYLPTLSQAWSESQEQLSYLTETYIRVRYGGVSPSLEELERAKQAWLAVKSRALVDRGTEL
ncbi:MAG TPA: hypothetical protein DCP08_02080 [Chloroflexi bacterium]|nr:hypothetical protein [Chloroflexota bacterium]